MRKKLKVKRFRCPVCSKPHRSQAGSASHWRWNHTHYGNAERNWNICYDVFSRGIPVPEVAASYDLSLASIRAVLDRYVQYPYHYELDPEIEISPLRTDPPGDALFVEIIEPPTAQ